MRIVLILLMCWGVAFGQDTTKYFKSVDYGWNWQRGKFRGGLILPTDTTNNKLGIAQIGATCFAWSGTKWNSIGSTDTSFLVRYYRKNQVDSAIAANSPALTLQDVTTNGKTTTDSIIAASFKRTGGTSSQFLKANGSVDNNTYVPYSSYGSNNVSANNFFDGFSLVAASGTQIVLTVNSTPSYLVTGSGGQTIKLPDATTLPNGTLFNFNNNQSSGAILVNNNSNTLVKSVPSGGNIIIELIDNSIAAGSWDAHSQAPSNVSWSTNTFDYAGSITSATWNGVNVALNRGGTGASTAAGARTNLGSTTVGDNFFTLTNPSAITFPRINADNTVSTLDASTFRTAIGAGTSSTSGTVTNVTATLPISVATGTTTPAISIADASASVSGVVTTGTQTIAGAKTFSGNTTLNATTTIGSSGILSINSTDIRFNTLSPYILFTRGSGSGVIFTPANTINSTTQNGVLIMDNVFGTVTYAAGSQTFNALAINTNINTSGSYVGTVRGIHYAPTLTSLTGVTHRAWENTTGDMYIASTSGNVGIGTAPSSTDKVQLSGNLSLVTAGNKLKIATGTNASVGTSTLASGTITVSTTAVTASSIIMLTLQSCSTCGTPYISAKTAGTSFVITSTNVLDASIVGWQIIN